MVWDLSDRFRRITLMFSLSVWILMSFHSSLTWSHRLFFFFLLCIQNDWHELTIKCNKYFGCSLRGDIYSNPLCWSKCFFFLHHLRYQRSLFFLQLFPYGFIVIPLCWVEDFLIRAVGIRRGHGREAYAKKRKRKKSPSKLYFYVHVFVFPAHSWASTAEYDSRKFVF